MCCAQTAAPEGKKNKRREMQKRGDCIIKSIITECSEIGARDGVPEGSSFSWESGPGCSGCRRCSQDASRQVKKIEVPNKRGTACPRTLHCSSCVSKDAEQANDKPVRASSL